MDLPFYFPGFVESVSFCSQIALSSSSGVRSYYAVSQHLMNLFH